MVVRLRHEAVVDARELAVDLEDGRGGDAVAGLVGLGVEDPAVGGAGELVALGEVVGGGVGAVVGREEEEDVAVGDGEVEDDAARGVFVAAGDVAVEGFKRGAVSKSAGVYEGRMGVIPLSALSQMMSSGLPPRRGTMPYSWSSSGSQAQWLPPRCRRSSEHFIGVMGRTT